MGISANASFVGAKTVNGPLALSALARSAAPTAVTSVVKSPLLFATATTVFGCFAVLSATAVPPSAAVPSATLTTATPRNRNELRCFMGDLSLIVAGRIPSGVGCWARWMVIRC